MKLKQIVIIIFAALIMVFTACTLAAAGEYLVFPAETEISINKTWTIKFNKQLANNTIIQENIKVIASGGAIVPVSLSLLSDGKTVQVSPPAGGYAYATKYTIIINGIKSADNVSLKLPAKKEFTTTAETRIIGEEKITIETADAKNTLYYGQKASLEIPPKTVPAGSQASVKEIVNAEKHAFNGLSTLNTYEISIGELKSFPNELRLGFKYDPAVLNPNYEPADQLFVAYWDPEKSKWVETDFSVDKANNEVVVTTNHLSLWSLFGFNDDTVITYAPHFRIYFKESLNAPILGTNSGADPIYQFAGNVRTALVNAYNNYAAAKGSTGGLKLPDNSKVYIDDWGAEKTAEWGWFSKNIEIPVTYSNLQELQHDCAHELFHAVQNQYVNVAAMASNRWWMEATADYAAASIGTGNGLADSLPHRFISKPLNSTADTQMYKVAHFIKYMVDKGIDFKDLYEYTMNSKNDVLSAINSYLNTKGTSLPNMYSAFVYDFIFGNNIQREPLTNDIYTDLADYKNEFGAMQATSSQLMVIDKDYTAKLAGFKVKDYPGTTVKLSAIEATSGVKVQYVVTSSAAGGVLAHGELSDASPVEVSIQNGNYLYFIATNSNQASGNVTVVINKKAEDQTVSRSRPAKIYNSNYLADVGFNLSSSIPFQVLDEKIPFPSGEYYQMQIKLTGDPNTQWEATVNVDASVSRLRYNKVKEGMFPFIDQSYWNVKSEKITGDSVTVNVNANDSSPKRLTYSIIIYDQYESSQAQVYGGGATVIDIVIQH